MIDTRRSMAVIAAAMILATTGLAEPAFHVYAPSPASRQLLVLKAKPTAGGIELSVESKVDLSFQGATIAAHPSKAVLYVGSGAAPPERFREQPCGSIHPAPCPARSLSP